MQTIANLQRAPSRRSTPSITLRRQWRPCEACGELTFGLLCDGCIDHSRPHRLDDPYDDLGGEAGSVE
jgi:hypothetical protein